MCLFSLFFFSSFHSISYPIFSFYYLEFLHISALSQIDRDFLRHLLITRLSQPNIINKIPYYHIIPSVLKHSQSNIHLVCSNQDVNKIHMLELANFSLRFFNLCVRVQSLQSCPTLWDAMDCSPPGSSVHGILQARILEWVAMPSSRGSSWPRNRTCVSCIAGGFFTHLSRLGSQFQSVSVSLPPPFFQVTWLLKESGGLSHRSLHTLDCWCFTGHHLVCSSNLTWCFFRLRFNFLANTFRRWDLYFLLQDNQTWCVSWHDAIQHTVRKQTPLRNNSVKKPQKYYTDAPVWHKYKKFTFQNL